MYYLCLFWGGIQFGKFLFKWKLYFVTIMMIKLLCSVSASSTMSNVANIPSSENYTPVDSCDKI